MMNFNDPRLIKKYGNWVRVQVAFYDFIFETATELSAGRWKEQVLAEMVFHFQDGDEVYERSVRMIEKTFHTPELAWQAFLKDNA